MRDEIEEIDFYNIKYSPPKRYAFVDTETEKRLNYKDWITYNKAITKLEEEL